MKWKTPVSFVQVSLKVKIIYKNHVTKFHGNNKQLKCTLYAISFSNKKILDAHITSVHQKENSKHTIEREPSLSNHKQKKNNL